MLNILGEVICFLVGLNICIGQVNYVYDKIG